MKGFHAQRPVLVMTILVMCLSACEKEASQPPTSTLRPATPVLTPTVTPFPPLPDEGPYLVMRRSNGLLLYSSDGHAREAIELPEGGLMRQGYADSLEKIISPDGQWLAYFTGNVDIYNGGLDLPFTLHLLNIND